MKTLFAVLIAICLPLGANAQVVVSEKSGRIENATGILQTAYGPDGEFVLWDKRPCENRQYDIQGLAYGSLPSSENVIVDGKSVEDMGPVLDLNFHEVRIVLYKYRVRTIGQNVVVLGDSLVIENLAPDEDPESKVRRESVEGYITVEEGGSGYFLTVLAQGKDDYHEVLSCIIDNETIIDGPGLKRFDDIRHWNDRNRFSVHVKFRSTGNTADIVSIAPLH